MAVSASLTGFIRIQRILDRYTENQGGLYRALKAPIIRQIFDFRDLLASSGAPTLSWVVQDVFTSHVRTGVEKKRFKESCLNENFYS